MSAVSLAAPVPQCHLAVLADYLESRAQAAEGEDAARLSGVAARLRRRAKSAGGSGK